MAAKEPNIEIIKSGLNEMYRIVISNQYIGNRDDKKVFQFHTSNEMLGNKIDNNDTIQCDKKNCFDEEKSQVNIESSIHFDEENDTSEKLLYKCTLSERTKTSKYVNTSQVDGTSSLCSGEIPRLQKKLSVCSDDIEPPRDALILAFQMKLLQSTILITTIRILGLQRHAVPILLINGRKSTNNAWEFPSALNLAATSYHFKN